MFLKIATLRERLHAVILNKGEQGYVTEGLDKELDSLPDSYDRLIEFAEGLASLSVRSDWKYVEPNDLDGIWAEASPNRPVGQIADVNLDDSTRRVEAAFLGSICGCILGKPLEARFTGHEIRKALQQIGEWPLNQYVSKQIESVLPRVHRSFPETAREYIRYVAPDDDINYTIMGMLILERFGPDFTHANMKELWLHHLPISTTFGPERTLLLQSGAESFDIQHRDYFADKGGVGLSGVLVPDESESFLNVFNDIMNPGAELCGAAIRADAYGYACPGNPEMAASLAWKDASFTHKGTGIYGTMFIAAVIACAQVMHDRVDIIETALRFVPRRSRFYERVSASLKDVRESGDWEEAYAKINNKFGEYGHCRIYQEIGMLINTFSFAENVGHGICIQVSQGADTDSFGATSGSILGAYFGPGHLESRWLELFNDDIHSGLAWFFERSLSKLGIRMGRLPSTVKEWLE